MNNEEEVFPAVGGSFDSATTTVCSAENLVCLLVHAESVTVGHWSETGRPAGESCGCRRAAITTAGGAAPRRAARQYCILLPAGAKKP